MIKSKKGRSSTITFKTERVWRNLKVQLQEIRIRIHLRCDLKAKDQKFNQVIVELWELAQQKQEPAKHTVFMKDQLSKHQNEGESIIRKVKQALDEERKSSTTWRW